MPPPIELRDLTKRYGAAIGVEHVTLTIGAGEIFGLLGPNGAGKTTLIRTLMGLLSATRGEARLFGDPVRTASDRHHERIGYLPADLRLWPGLTARRLSDLMLGLGTNGTTRTERRDELARRLDLNLDTRIRSLSLGNRQKAGLLLALQHDPDLLILDEPTSGLDPLLRRRVMTLLREFAARGGTIVYSSHNLNEVEEICSRVGIMRRGRLAALKTIGEIRSEREQRLEFVFAPGTVPPQGLPTELDRFTLTAIEPRRWQVRFTGPPGPLLRWLAGFDLSEISSPAVSLEEAFLAYYRDDLAETDRSEAEREPIA